jgi:1-acyl-sn-glycerol-3-phosphate acyltransferase
MSCYIPPFGRYVLKPVWYGFVAPIFRRVFKVEVHNREVLETEEPLIVAPNHRSYIDPPLLNAVSPEPLVFLAKKELFEGKTKNWFFRNMNAIPVDRSRADLNALNEALGRLSQGCKVCIFPEGKRAPSGGFLKPKPGIGYLVAKAKVKVVPVYLHNTEKVMGKSDKFPKPAKEPVKIIFGQPLEFKDVEDSPKGYKAVANQIMEEIKKLAELV